MTILSTQMSRAVLVFALIGVCLSACAPDSTAPADLGAKPKDFSPSHLITNLGSFNAPIPSTSSEGAAPYYGANDAGGQVFVATGIVIPANTHFRVRVQGTVTTTKNPELASDTSFHDYQELGTFGPGGTGSNNDLRIVLQLVATDGSGQSTTINTGAFPAGSTDSVQTVIQQNGAKAAQLFVGRVGVGGKKIGIGFYSLTASQSVTVDQFTDWLHVSANPMAVRSGQAVTFSAWAETSPSLTIFGWWWGNDPGVTTTPTATCGPDLTPVI